MFFVFERKKISLSKQNFSMDNERMAYNIGKHQHFHRNHSSSLVWFRWLAVLIISSLLIFENVCPSNSSTIQAEYDSIKSKPKLVIVDTVTPSTLSPTSGKKDGQNHLYSTDHHSGGSKGHNNNNNNHKNNHHGGSNDAEHGEDGEKSPPPPPRRFPVAKFDFEHVSGPYIILLWIIIVGLAKMGFHVTPKLSSICPESVVLMILGVMIGLIMYFAGIPEERLQPLTPELFFLYMLPPIVMDAGYHMPNRLFFDNLVSILLYAVVGTIWNTMAIGLSLYGCSKWGLFGEEIPFLDLMLFSSTVSAVDPVAVLAVFEEIHVNEVLYILVFGESLLNDGVTVVLYHMFEGYAEIAYHYGIDSLQPIDYISGVASFFVVAIGGTAMGVFWGFLAAFVSRFTHHVKIIEPIFVFVMAYLSYLSAEMFHLSGILSLTFCGITMKNYVEENITQKSHTTLKYAMKMLANSSEAIIFVFLGVCTVNDQHHWNTPFVMCTIIFCLVYRTIGVVALTSLTNRFRLHKVNGVEQFIMAYGGLRGAVAFALILIIDRQIIHAREMFVTTIIAMVYFTVFLQGMTVGTLVKILNVPRANKFELTMNERIHTRLMDHLMAGVEDISGMMMGNYKLRDKFRHYNNQFLRKWLLRDSKEMGNSSRKIFETCSRLDLRDALTLVSKQHLLAATAAAAVSSTSNNNNVKLQDPTLSFAFANANYVITDEDEISDTNNNNNNKNNNNYSNKRPSLPKMFLNVPVNPAFATSVTRDQASCVVSTPPPSLIPIISGNVDVGSGLVDPNQALSQFLRTYTQSNLSALNDDDDDDDNNGGGGDQIEPNSLLQMAADDDQTNPSNTNDGIMLTPMTNGTVDFNYDIGTMVYSPSLKDLKDAELHHILNDAMFKPFKKAHHYCRSDYHDEEEESSEPHPPFQHQVRMHIRKLLTEKQNQRHRRHSHQHFYDQPPSKLNNPHHHHHHHHQHHQHHHHPKNGAQNAHLPHNQNPASNLEQISEQKSFRSNNKSDEDDDQDGGITFVAGQDDDHDETKRPGNMDVAENKKKDEEDDDDDDDDDEVFPDKVDNVERKPRLSFPWRRRSSVATNNSGETDINNPDSSVTSISSANNHEIASAAQAIVANINRSSTTAARKRRLKEGVVRQREFPAWIKNPDYVDGYGSPTITLLERISFFGQKPESVSRMDDETATRNDNLQMQQQQQQQQQQPQQQSSNQKNVPSVYEIFQLDKEDDEHREDVPNGSTSKVDEQNSINSNDTVIEFKRAPQSKIHYKTDEEVEEDEDSSLVIISKL